MIGQQVVPSEAACSVLTLPDGRPYSFRDREWLRLVMDDKRPSQVWKAGRQVGKSSTLGAKLCLHSLTSFHPSLYVAPRERQSQDFSKDKLAKIIGGHWFQENMVKGSANEDLGSFEASDAVLDKVFTNRAHIKLRYAFRSADHIRGITARTIAFDETQDLLTDHIWVILECQSSFNQHQKRTYYAGTPKTFETPLEERWDESTKYEWMLKCGCGFWQFILPESIAIDTRCYGGPTCRGHVICRRCGRSLDARTGTWIATGDDDANIAGFRMPQVLNPQTDWHGENGIIAKASRMSDQLFNNEVLALPHDAANRVFEMSQLESLCNPSLSLSAYRTAPEQIEVFAGIDWAEGGVSDTVLIIGAWMSYGKFKVFHAKIYPETDPLAELEDMIATCARWGCRVVGCDMGAGRIRNKTMIRKLAGRCNVLQFHYPGNTSDQTPKVRFNRKSGIAQLHRHRTLDDVVLAIREGRVEFPRQAQFAPFLKHLEYVRQDYNSKTRQIYFDHPGSRPDDTFHALNFGMVAGHLWRGGIKEAA